MSELAFLPVLALVAGSLSGFMIFLLHRLFALRADVSAVQTAIHYKNEKLESIENRVNKIGDEIDEMNKLLSSIATKVNLNS